jgi:hypothetical protein
MHFSYKPEIAFRGLRSYVHSTDLYEQLLLGAVKNGVFPDGPIDVRIRRAVTRHVEFRYSNLPQTRASGAPVTFSLRAGSELWSGYAEELNEDVHLSKPYDETPIWTNAQCDGRSVWTNVDTGMQPIEIITALAVFLHRRLHTPVGSKWLLTGLRLNHPLKAEISRSVKIEFQRAVDRATRSGVIHAEAQVGELDFMLGKIA